VGGVGWGTPRTELINEASFSRVLFLVGGEMREGMKVWRGRGLIREEQKERGYNLKE